MESMKNQRLSIRRARLSTPENQKQNPFDVIEPSSAMQSQEMPMLPAATDRKEEPEVKEVELVQYRQKPLLKKSVKDGFSSYKYTGPINQDIQYYLDDLYQREGAVSAEGLYYRLNAWNKRVDSQIEKKIPLNCVDGPISVNKDSLVLFLIMMICSTYFAISVGVTSEPDDDALKFFKSYGPGSTFIFTFYGLIFLSLPAVFAFGIAIAQILIPLFFILFDYNLIFTRDETPSLDSETLVIRIAITVPAIAWGLLYVPFWLLRKNVGRLTSHLFIAIIYVGVFLCAMGLPILRLLQSNGSFDSSFFEDNSSIIYLLSIFFIIFSWLIIHFKYFWVPTKVLEFTLMNLARRAARKPVPPHKMEQQKTVQDVNEIKVPTFKDKVFKHIYWISSVACGGAYMGIELYLLTETITAFKNDETNGFIASFFFLIASPIFLLIGIPIALSKFRVRNKSLVLPLITIVPMFGIVPLAEALTTYQAGEDLKLFFIVGPPTAIFFWLAMAFIGLKKRKIFYGIFTFSCLFLFLPFIFLGLGQSSYFEEVQTGFFGAFYALISLFSIGILILIGYLMVRYVFRFIKRKIQEAQKKREIEKAYYEKIRKIQQKRKSKIEGAKSQTEQEELDEEELDEIELDEFDHSLANIEQGGLLESARKRRSQGSLPSVAQQGGKTASGTDNKLGLSLKRSQTKTKIGSHQAEGGENAGNPGGVLSMLVIEEEKFNPEEKKRGFFGKSSKKTNTKQSMNLNILKDIELKKKLQLLSVMYLNLKNIGFWINASAFIVSYTFIAYTYFNMSISVTDTEHGILLGATIVMPVIFIINNLLIRLKTAKLSTDERRVYEKKDKMERIFFEDQLDRDEERIRTASLLEACVLLFGIFLIPIFEIPFFFIFDDRVGRTALVLIMIVCIFFSLFVAGIIELKKRSGPFHKFFVPSFISLFWVIVILPFVVIIPMVAAILVTYSDDFKVFVKLSLLGSAFLLMFGVTSFAILFNIIFQKIEKEKLIKYLIKTLSKFLKEHAVKADDVVIRRLIEEYFKKENEEELEKLKKSLIDDRIPIVPIYPPKFKVTTNYSAGLLLIDTYYQIMRKSQQLKNKGIKQKTIRSKESCWSRLARLCGDQEELDEDFEGVQDMAFDDDSYFKADNYLPEDFENRMWNYALGDFNPVQTPVVQDNGDPRMMVIDLTSKPTKDDIDFRDHMTPVLESIINIPLTSSELKNWNHNEHALILNSSLTQTEIWYQHVFDYFSGKTPPHDNNGSSQGMIYQNFIQFIRVTQLDKEKGVQPELLDSFFANFASKQIGKAHCLPYSGFIQALVETSSRVFSETLHEEKNLRRFTKKIYPPIMARIQDINKVYSGSLMTFTKPRAPYVPHLDLFDKKKEQIQKPSINIHPEGGSSLLPVDASNYDFQKGEPVSFGRKDLSRKSYTSAMVEEIVQERRSSIFPSPNTLQAHHVSFSLSQDGGSPKTGDPMKRMSAFASPSPKNKKKPPTKSTCLRMLTSLESCWNSFYAKMAACLYYSFFVLPKKVGDWVYKKTKRVGKSFGFDIDEGDDSEDDVAIRRVAQEAPAWPILVDKIFFLLPRSIAIYFQSQREKEVLLQFNLTNVTTVLGKIAEIYTYISLAFRPQVPWFGSTSASDVILIVSGESSWFDSFKFLFWLGFALAIIYLIISVPAIQALRKGKLGEDEFGKKASFPHPQFFLTFCVTILGASLFPQVMRYLLYAYVCDYSELPWTLTRDSDIECLSDEHALYMGMGAIALLIYYPISTFMFPNFQFQNKVLDLKYDPSFVVLNIQAKLLISAFTSFFKPVSNVDTENIKIQLIGCACVLFCLAFLTFILKPCLIKKANVWDISAYSLAFWVNICALVVIFTDNSTIGWIMLGAGSVAILALTIFVLKKFYGKKQRKRDNHQIASVRFNPNKRKAKVEDDADQDKVNEIMQAIEREKRKQARENGGEFMEEDDYYETQKGAII